MINIPIQIQIPQLWDTKTFSKSEWGEINLIVGPNGTGKSLLADQLKVQLSQSGLTPRILNAERLSGFQKQNYDLYGASNLNKGLNISDFNSIKSNGEMYGLSSSAFIILKERLDIKVKIEALLSDIFKKSFRLVEEGGYLKPKIQNHFGGHEYGLKESECHGLKELMTLLTFLYDESKNCLILDEPELHLHPQFQSFLLNEIRRLAGNPNNEPSKKIFFIITHSPYFLDLRSVDDLKSILVCHYSQPPNSISTLTPQDEYILKRFLPRFNTHHKQFFFSPNPVFVEGYTDQQIITLLFDKLDYNISASGSGIIDVGGKDELAVFFRLCKSLGLKARVIADLDALFRGKLREVAQLDERCNIASQEKGLGANLSSPIGELERKLKDVADDLVTKTPSDPDMVHLVDFLKPIVNLADKRIDVIVGLLLAIQKFQDKILSLASQVQQANIIFIVHRFHLLLETFAAANIYIFPKGEIEHYYTQTALDYLHFTDTNKNTAFHTEREHILDSNDKDQLESQYSELIAILKSSVPQVSVDLSKHLKFLIIEWIQTVQRAISKGEVSGRMDLESSAKIDYKLFSQILEVTNLQVQSDKKFQCKIKIARSLTTVEREIDFSEKTTPHEFELSM
jgi:ABC-type multidrug transport system ATPase subunit